MLNKKSIQYADIYYKINFLRLPYALCFPRNSCPICSNLNFLKRKCHYYQFFQRLVKVLLLHVQCINKSLNV